jgi:IstB-like ATP binding protein
VPKRTCEYCQTPYHPWEPGEFALRGDQKAPEPILVPGCTCLGDRAEAAYQQHLKDEWRTRGLAAYHKLLFDTHAIADEEVITIPGGVWADPKAEVLAGNKLAISGPSGTSKSYAIKYLARELSLHGFKVRGGGAQSIMDALKDFDGLAQETFNHLMNGQVLVLDDICKLRCSPFELDRLMVLVDTYDEVGKSILTTMNVKTERLVHQLGVSGGDVATKAKAEALISRLYNRCTCIEQDPNTPSYRAPGKIVKLAADGSRDN